MLGCTNRSVCGAPWRKEDASQRTVNREQSRNTFGLTGNFVLEKARVPPYAAPVFAACSLVELALFHSAVLQLCASKRNTVRDLVAASQDGRHQRKTECSSEATMTFHPR